MRQFSFENDLGIMTFLKFCCSTDLARQIKRLLHHWISFGYLRRKRFEILNALPLRFGVGHLVVDHTNVSENKFLMCYKTVLNPPQNNSKLSNFNLAKNVVTRYTINFAFKSLLPL